MACRFGLARSLDAEEKKEIDQLRPRLDAARKKLAELEKNKADKKEIDRRDDELERLRKQEYTLSHGEAKPASTAN